jgi:hypothetical protein
MAQTYISIDPPKQMAVGFWPLLATKNKTALFRKCRSPLSVRRSLKLITESRGQRPHLDSWTAPAGPSRQLLNRWPTNDKLNAKFKMIQLKDPRDALREAQKMYQ